MKYFLANWKENKNWAEAEHYFEAFAVRAGPAADDKRRLIFFPPTPFVIPLCQRFSSKLWGWGVQDISRFADGAHTGEASAAMVQGFASHALLGHSERRRDLGEDDEGVNEKLCRAVEAALVPVVCLSQPQQAERLRLPKELTELCLVYEPVAFIGGDATQDLKLVTEFHASLRRLFPTTPFRFIYGGSVGPQNAHDFLKEDFVDGLLVGHNSLDPQVFWQITQAS